MKTGNMQAFYDWSTLIGQISINWENFGKCLNKIFPINGIQLYIMKSIQKIWKTF